MSKRKPSPQLGMHLGEPVPQLDMLAEWRDLTPPTPDRAALERERQAARPLPGQLRLEENTR